MYNLVSYISFKIVPLINNTILSATGKVLETFLKVILWTPFQLFRRILNDVSSTTKALSLHCWFQSSEQVKIRCSQVRTCGGCSIVVTMLFGKKSLTITDTCAGSLSWKTSQLLVLHFFFFFLLTAPLKRWRMPMPAYETDFSLIKQFL
jgi:hypothetical protein